MPYAISQLEDGKAPGSWRAINDPSQATVEEVVVEEMGYELVWDASQSALRERGPEEALREAKERKKAEIQSAFEGEMQSTFGSAIAMQAVAIAEPQGERVRTIRNRYGRLSGIKENIDAMQTLEEVERISW